MDNEQDVLDRDKDPSICPHNDRYMLCKKPECIEEMCKAEEAAYCPHNFLVGCPICLKEMK